MEGKEVSIWSTSNIGRIHSDHLQSPRKNSSGSGSGSGTGSDSQRTDELSSIYSLNLMETIQNESERRSLRAKKMRSKRKGYSSKKKSKSASRSSSKRLAGNRVRSNSSGTNGTNGTGTRSIMIVRTLQESLATTADGDQNWKAVMENKHKRSILRRRLDSSVRSNSALNISNSSSTSSSSPFSDTGSFSSITSLSNVSTQNFEVKFDDVTIREYTMIPGDNPSVTRGPPVTIDWIHNYEQSHDIEYYERVRQKHRRRQEQMKMPPDVREDLLINSGYSFSVLREYSRQATIVRRQRTRTIELLHTDNVEEKVEAIKRIVKKPFRSREEKDEERKIVAYYRPEKVRRGKKNHPDLDTTRRADNRSEGTMMFKESDPLDVSRSGRKYDLQPLRENNVNSINILDVSRHGQKQYDLFGSGNDDLDTSRHSKKYDLLGNQNTFVSDLRNSDAHDLDTSRHGKKYDLLGNQQDALPDLLESSLDSLDSSTKMRRTSVENVSRWDKKRRSLTPSSQNLLNSLDSSSRMRKVDLAEIS